MYFSHTPEGRMTVGSPVVHCLRLFEGAKVGRNIGNKYPRVKPVFVRCGALDIEWRALPTSLGSGEVGLPNQNLVWIHDTAARSWMPVPYNQSIKYTLGSSAIRDHEASTARDHGAGMGARWTMTIGAPYPCSATSK